MTPTPDDTPAFTDADARALGLVEARRMLAELISRWSGGDAPGSEDAKDFLEDDRNRVPKMSDRPRNLAISAAMETLPLGQPAAAAMSDEEIAAALAAGRDPWAEDDTGTCRVTEHPAARRLAIHLRAARLLADPAVREALTSPATICIIRTDPACDNIRQVGTALRDSLVPALRERLGVPGLAPISAAIGADPELVPRAEKHRGIDEKLSEAMETCVLSHQTGIALMDTSLALEPSLAPFLRAERALPPLDAEVVCDLLRLTHSRTGKIAEDAVRERLPPAAALAAMPPLHLEVAFREPTTLSVAARLADLVPAQVAEAGLTLDDVKGLPGDVRVWLDGMVNDLDAVRAGRLPWAEVTRSAVLHGPPGTGKTMLAAALAGSAGANLVETSYADCQRHGHQGSMLAALRAAFDEAARTAPAVLFIDELDSFTDRSRERKDRSYMRGVVNGLLEQLNRGAEMEGVLLLAATNHLDAIDPAILRAGRFDLKLEIPAPDRDGLIDILRAHLAPDSAIPETTIAGIADRIVGATGADVASLVRQAGSIARLRGETIRGADLDQAVAMIARPVPGSVLRRMALHEAGHLIVGTALGLGPAERMQLSVRGGAVSFPNDPIHTRADAERQLGLLLAGRAAERLVYGEPATGCGAGTASDLAQATRLAMKMELQWGLGPGGPVWHADPEPPHPTSLPAWLRARIAALLNAAEDRAAAILENRLADLHAIAGELVDSREIGAARLAQLVAGDGPDDAATVVRFVAAG